MWLAAALKEWHEFYLLIGTAGATLMALLFVALSVGVGYLRAQQAAATRIFMSPVVIHFTSVLFISAVALIPTHRAAFFAVLIGSAGLIGMAVSTVVTIRVFKSSFTADIADHLCYGLLPALGYAGTLVAAALIFADSESSLDMLAGAMLLLLIVNIRNAWDLTLTMVHKHREEHGAQHH